MNTMIPAFKIVFGTAWDKLPPIFQKRYANRSFSDDLCTFEGKMTIAFSNIMILLMPLFRLFKVLVPYQGQDIPVKVNFRSQTNTDTVYLDRQFYFPGNSAYEFNSYMQPIAENTVIEYMAFGLGWKTNYFYDGEKVVMQHKGYIWKLFGLNIPMPLEIFVGRGHAEETVIDDNSYRVNMTMTHPLFGLLYYYVGNFTCTRLPR